MFNRKEGQVEDSSSSSRHADRFGFARWHWPRSSTCEQRYQVCDRLHKDRVVNVPGSEIASIVGAWLADLGVQSPWVDQLAGAIQADDWATVRAVCDHLSVDVSYAA
jgi:hypothetical protein